MTSKIILLISMLAYSVIVSQSFMYVLAFKDVQIALDAEAYTELRKLTDTAMRANFKYVIYAALFANVLLVVANCKAPGSIVFITASVALAALIIDITLTLKGSLPINDLINSWAKGNIPTNWAEVRERWFRIFQYRQIATIIGFTSLLAGIVFRGK